MQTLHVWAAGCSAVSAAFGCATIGFGGGLSQEFLFWSLDGPRWLLLGAGDMLSVYGAA
jgi:hypothetical protein